MNWKKVIVSTTVGLFVVVFFVIFSLATTFHPQTYRNINLDGFHTLYHLGEPIVFTVIGSGYGLAPCGGPVTKIFDIEDPTKPVFSDNGGDWICPAMQSTTSYTDYYPSKTNPFSIMINKTGIYRLDVNWGYIRSGTYFDIIPTSTNENDSASNQTIIKDISYLDAAKKFLDKHTDAVARVENGATHEPRVVDYYTKTGLFNGTIGTFSTPQYRTLKLLVPVNLVNNTAIPSYIEIVCSVSSYDNKTQEDYTLFPHNDLNLTFNDALQSDRCLSEGGR